MTTRGGQGTAENIISSTNPIFYEPHLWVPKDIHPDTARHVQTILREMEKSRNTNAALEKRRLDEDEKKSSPPSKKRITASDVMSEQQMFQEELLKLVERVGRVEARQNKMIRVLNSLQQRFQEHISLDLPGATPVENTTSSLGIGDTTTDQQEQDGNRISVVANCLACNKLVRDCKCFDD